MGLTSIFLTGHPGVGKTTVVERVVYALMSRGLRVGGMITKEVREGGKRIGFEILDIESGVRGWLAHVKREDGPVIGRYRVNLRDLEDVGVRALIRSIEEADIIVCDEIGPMERTSSRFREVIVEVLASGKPFIATLHHRYSEDLVEEVRCASQFNIIKITYTNRDILPLHVTSLVLKEIRGS
ncbi:MAG: NTPase [Nitrososphaeria archaeon]|nr:NTPase [Nitrososphaeria archaeon]